MLEINRSLVVVKPKEPFLKWAQSLEEPDSEWTLEEFAEDASAYLIPELWEPGDEREMLKLIYEALFVEQLRDWYTDEASWPQERSLEMFLEWFEVEFHSLVFDLVGEPIGLSIGG